MAIAIGAGVSLGSGIFVEKEFAGTWQTLRNLSQQLDSADYVFNNSTSMQDIQTTIESQSDDWNVITVVLGDDAGSKFALNNTLSAQSGGINPIVSSAGQFIANQDDGAPGWLSTGEPLSRFTGGGVAGYPQVDGLPWMATAWFDDTSFVGITVHVFDFTITRAADIFASLTAQSIYSLAFGPDGALEVPALSTSWCWSSLSQVGSEGFVTATSRLSAVGGYLAVAGAAGKTLNGNGATNLEINNAANQAYGAGLTIAATESTAELFWNGVSQGTQFMGFCFVPDRSAPSYDSLTLNAPRYNEGDSPVITLNTTNILAGTTVDYSVSPGTEVTPNTGTITITSSGRSTSTFAINTDETEEGDQTLTVTLNPTDSTGNATGNLTANATIHDTTPPGPSFAWDVSAAVFVQSYSVAAQEANPLGLFFKPDGTKMYVCGDQGDDVNEYSLSTPWDISGGSVLFVRSQSMVSAGYNFFCGLFFKPDGTKMYSMANAGVNAAVHEWDLSVPWNVATLVYVQRKLTGSQDSGPSGVFFQDDGLTMYTVGAGNDRVYQYTLSTAWDVSTLTYVQFFSVSAQTGDPRGLWFKPDGTKMYITSADGANDAVHEYDLGIAWDITSAVYLQSLSTGAQDSYATGPVFRSDGQKMYILGLGGDRVYEYDL